MHKNAQKLSEKLAAEFLATKLSYSIVTIACLEDAVLELFELGAGQSQLQKA